MTSADQLIEEGKKLISCPDSLLVDDKQAREVAEIFKALSKNFGRITNLITSKRKSITNFTLETSDNGGVCFIVHD